MDFPQFCILLTSVLQVFGKPATPHLQSLPELPEDFDKYILPYIQVENQQYIQPNIQTNIKANIQPDITPEIHLNVQATVSSAIKPSTDSHNYDVFKVKNYGKEEASVEKETVLSKIDSKYEKAQSLFPVEPVVDNVKESQKYGNEAKVSQTIGHIVTGGMDIISNLINGVIEGQRAVQGKFLKNINTILGTFASNALVG